MYIMMASRTVHRHVSKFLHIRSQTFSSLFLGVNQNPYLHNHAAIEASEDNLHASSEVSSD